MPILGWMTGEFAVARDMRTWNWLRGAGVTTRRTSRGGRRVAAFLVVLLGGVAEFANAQRLQFRQLTPDHGLSSTWIESVLQDSRGFMWFGTKKGLNRYDAYTFAIYRHRASDTTSLGDSYAQAIHEDRQKTLWVGTSAGLSRYDRERDAFVNHRIVPKQTLAVGAILDAGGILWIGTTRGLYQFDRVTGKATPYRATATGPATIAGEVIALFEDRKKHIWIGTRTEGARELDPLTGAVRSWRSDSASPGDLPRIGANEVRSFVEDRGVVWVGMKAGGLDRIDHATGAVTHFQHDAANPHSLAINTVYALALDDSRGLWVGTENGGLDYFDFATQRFEHNRFDPNNPTGLNNDSIHSLYRDAGGLLWVGTYFGGVNISRRNGDAIRRYRSMVGDPASLSSNSAYRFWEDTKGRTWVATEGGGLNLFDRAKGKFTRYSTQTSNLNSNSILALGEDRFGNVWVGTFGGGVSRFDAKTGRFTAYTTKNSALADDMIFALYFDKANQLWLGTLTHGLQRFDPERNVSTGYAVGTIKASFICLIDAMADGTLLLGTNGEGLILFDPKSAATTYYRPGEKGISGSSAQAVLETSPGIIWVGTQNGLERIDRRTNRIDHFTEDDGLSGPSVAGLAMDASRRLWASGDRGITLFDSTTKGRVFTIDDGLQGSQFSAGASYVARDGTLFFGGNQGFNILDPERLTKNPHAPSIALTGFNLFNKPVVLGAKRSPLQENVTVAKEVVLHHDQSVFSIEYAALDFSAPEKNTYAYRLEGLNKDWNEVGTARVATYTNLPAGQYVFHVKGTNNDGVWNEQGSRIDITILPPFWATLWFRTLILMAAVTGVLYFVHSTRARRRALERTAERDRASQQYLEGNVVDILGAMQRFSTGDYSVTLDVTSDDSIGKLRFGFNAVVADLKHAEEELRQSKKMEAVGQLAGGVAHDFNNLLTVIKGNAELGLADLDGPDNSKETVREELEEIERAAERASSLTRQLLAFSRKQILKPQTLSLNALVEDVGRILRRTVGEDIALAIVLDPSLGAVRADPSQLEQVVLNLVMNARDAMPRGGEVRIETRNVDADEVREFSEADNVPYVVIVVTDTGTGMAPEVKERAFDPFFTTKGQGKGTGLGLSTVYGSVKQSGGFVLVDSEPGQGSRFSVYLPRVAEANAPVSTSLGDRSPRGTATVLLAEDEDAVRRFAARVLTRAGYNVLTAPNGQSALEVAAQYGGLIDLLLTDVVMPGMSGRELGEALLPLRPGMRLLYASGYTEDAIIRHGVSSAGTAFLDKPFTSNGLLCKVREVLDANAPAPSPVSVAPDSGDHHLRRRSPRAPSYRANL